MEAGGSVDDKFLLPVKYGLHVNVVESVRFVNACMSVSDAVAGKYNEGLLLILHRCCAIRQTSAPPQPMRKPIVLP